MARTYELWELYNDTERLIAKCPDLDDAERLMAAMRAARNELTSAKLGEYGLGSLSEGVDSSSEHEYEWEVR